MRSEPRPAVLAVTLGFLQTLSTLTIDIYLPAFPRIAAELAVPESSIQFTFTGAMIGMVVGQLLAGAWSDVVGRRTPLTVATAVHVVASLACAVAPDVTVLTVARVLQGAASASVGVLAIAMVRDRFSGVRMLRTIASMTLVSGVAIAIGPLLGSFLLTVVTWRGVFVLLAAYGLVLGIVTRSIAGETMLRPALRVNVVRARISGVASLLRDRRFVSLVAVTAASWGGMYGYLSASSVIFQRHFGLTATAYGVAFASHALCMMVGSQLGARLASHVELRRLVVLSTSGLLLSALGLATIVATGTASFWGVLAFLWCFTLFLGLNTPTVQTWALSRRGSDIGTAASWLNASRQGLGVLSTAAIGGSLLPPLAATVGVILVAQVVVVLVLWLVVRPFGTQDDVLDVLR